VNSTLELFKNPLCLVLSLRIFAVFTHSNNQVPHFQQEKRDNSPFHHKPEKVRRDSGRHFCGGGRFFLQRFFFLFFVSLSFARRSNNVERATPHRMMETEPEQKWVFKGRLTKQPPGVGRTLERTFVALAKPDGLIEVRYYVNDVHNIADPANLMRGSFLVNTRDPHAVDPRSGLEFHVKAHVQPPAIARVYKLKASSENKKVAWLKVLRSDGETSIYLLLSIFTVSSCYLLVMLLDVCKWLEACCCEGEASR
jgi:hypothetical protein